MGDPNQARLSSTNSAYRTQARRVSATLVTE
jgi:hypothetical protein